MNGSSSTSGSAPASPRPAGCARFCPCCWPARSPRRGRSGSTSPRPVRLPASKTGGCSWWPSRSCSPTWLQLAARAGAGARPRSRARRADPLAASIAGLALRGRSGCCSRARSPPTATPGGPVCSAASPPPRSPSGWSRPVILGRPLAAHRRRRPRGADALPRRGRARSWRRSSRCCTRSATCWSRRSPGCCCGAAPGPARSTPGCASCAADGPRRGRPAPKLVLCVIDAMAPEMLERTIAAGTAPVLERLVQRGHYVPDCVAAFPSVTPVCAASIVTGPGQDEHLIPAMNWFHREEDRYVEYGSSFRAAQRFGIARQLTDTVYNMNRAHLSAETLDRVRVPRRRRRAHGRHDLPDVPRAPPPRAPARHGAHARGRGADAPPGDGPARAVLRRHLRLAAHRLPLGPRHAGRARPPLRAACPPTWSSTTCSTSCCSRCPTTTGTRTSAGPDGQLHSIAQADLQLARVAERRRRASTRSSTSTR